jgi:hypothetical protein
MENKHLIEAARNILENNTVDTTSIQEISTNEQFIEEIVRAIVEEKQELNEVPAVSFSIIMDFCINVAAQQLGSGASLMYIRALAATYFALVVVGPFVLLSLYSRGVGGTLEPWVIGPFRGIWNAIKGKYILKPDELEKAADNVKALLTGNDKGKITRLTNAMKKNIENKDWESAQVVADQLYKLIKK